MQYVKCLVHKDAEIKLPVAVPSWEVSILEAKFGEVEVLGKVDGVDRDIDAQSEYYRMESKHGRDNDTKQPYVQIAYGQEHEGRLKAAIDKAMAAEAVTGEGAGDVDPADLDGDGEVERHEIKVQLDELGVEYNPRARTETLRGLLDQVQTGIDSGGEEEAAVA